MLLKLIAEGTKNIAFRFMLVGSPTKPQHKCMLLGRYTIILKSGVMVIERKRYCIYVVNEKNGPGRRLWMQRVGHSPIDAQIKFAVPFLSV